MSKSVRPKMCMIEVNDIPNIVDAVFDPDHEMPGCVLMFANSKGRDHIDSLFPRARIAWRGAGPQFPDDWRGFKINLPVVALSTETKLPFDIIPSGRTIDDSTPRQLALLLACGVKRDGGRAAILDHTKDRPSLALLTPREN
ncbi:MAG: hypothetical protein J2P54_01830 [Bradyrhizobiaceae bacterium]|nr:hypothetical protein [Bradyrhizobiaceae bacterium]